MLFLVVDRVVDNLFYIIEYVIREERFIQLVDYFVVDNYFFSRLDFFCIFFEDLNVIIIGILNSIISSMRFEKLVEIEKEYLIEVIL